MVPGEANIDCCDGCGREHAPDRGCHWYSPAFALRFSPGAVRWALRVYPAFLSRGCWPPKPGKEGYESEGYIPGKSKGHQAPHEVPSMIAGELWNHLKSVGRVGMALYQHYALGWEVKSIAYQMGWAEYGLKCQMNRALKEIWWNANPDKRPCPVCGRFTGKEHNCG